MIKDQLKLEPDYRSFDNYKPKVCLMYKKDRTCKEEMIKKRVKMVDELKKFHEENVDTHFVSLNWEHLYDKYNYSYFMPSDGSAIKDTNHYLKEMHSHLKKSGHDLLKVSMGKEGYDSVNLCQKVIHTFELNVNHLVALTYLSFICLGKSLISIIYNQEEEMFDSILLSVTTPCNQKISNINSWYTPKTKKVYIQNSEKRKFSPDSFSQVSNFWTVLIFMINMIGVIFVLSPLLSMRITMSISNFIILTLLRTTLISFTLCKGKFQIDERIMKNAIRKLGQRKKLACIILYTTVPLVAAIVGWWGNLYTFNWKRIKRLNVTEILKKK